MSLVEQKTQLFCKLYRQHTEDAFEEALMQVRNAHLMDERELSVILQQAVIDAESEWLDEPHAELEGMSPRGFVASLEDEKDLLDFIQTSALHLDDSLPLELASALRERGGIVEPQLIEWAVAGHRIDFDGSERMPKELLLAIRATDLLSSWRVPLAQTRLLDGYIELDNPAPIWSEAIQAYLEAQGKQAVEPMIDLLNREHEKAFTDTIRRRRDTEDYLLIALTSIGQDAPDEEIYQMLRRSFRETEPRLIPVICLGDYGDARAVTMLRHYLIREAHMTDEATYYEIISTIQRLGGTTDDLPDPFTPDALKR